MYKTLNKKSSIYKSNVNTITAKINQIGNLDQLQIRLSKLEQDLELLQKQANKIQRDYTLNNREVNPYMNRMLSYNDKLNGNNINNTLSYAPRQTIEYPNSAQEELNNLLKTGLTYEDLAKMLYG